MLLTFRYWLLPTKAQHRALERVLESQRELYNAALEERIGAWRKAARCIGYFDQTKSLTEWRREDDVASNTPLNVQRATLKRLDDAFRGFFRRLRAGDKPGFPRYRGKGRFDSFGFREFAGITLDGRRLRFKGIPGSIRVHWHRDMPESPIKACNFKRSPEGWRVAFTVEVAGADLRDMKRAVGIDLGLSTFATLSDGGRIPSLKAARRADRNLRIAQRTLARRKRGSKGRSKAHGVVRRCYSTIARKRREHLHQASARLVRDYDAVAVESLRVKGLARGFLAKSVQDASWATFISMLRYKAEKAGVRLIEVNPSNTTQDCSECKRRVAKTLSDRWHACPECGLSIDRDLNAARNILNRAGLGPGLHNVAECGMRAGENLR